MKKILTALCLLLAAAAAAQNPISPMGVYIADPSARVVDGRVYVYGSLDESPGHYCSKSYHVLSSGDLLHWDLHPFSFRSDVTLYAPDMMGSGGTYYLYYDTPSGDEFVARSSSPTGPFGDGVKIEGPTQIDPAVFVDDDGQAYYYWGQFSAKGALMNPDMESLDLSTVVDGVVTEKDHSFHEGSWVVRHGEYYYFIFADISRRSRPTCLGYAMSKSPLGPYEYKGVIVDNAGCDPETWNNHGSLVEFDGRWYVLYHRSTHASRSMRKACLEPIRFNGDGTIDEVEMTSQGAGGPLDATSVVDAARACRMGGNVRIRLTAGRTDREELGAIRDGDWAQWKYLDFGRGVSSVSLRLRPDLGGTVVVRADGPDGKELGRVKVPAGTGWTVCRSKIRRIGGVHALWLGFEGPSPDGKGGEGGERELFSLDWVRFR